MSKGEKILDENLRLESPLENGSDRRGVTIEFFKEGERRGVLEASDRFEVIATSHHSEFRSTRKSTEKEIRGKSSPLAIFPREKRKTFMFIDRQFAQKKRDGEISLELTFLLNIRRVKNISSLCTSFFYFFCVVLDFNGKVAP